MKKSTQTFRNNHIAGSGSDSVPRRKDGTATSDRPTVPAQIKDLLRLQRQRDNGFASLRGVVLNARVFIIEGISGSGKDVFQQYLTTKLKGKDVHDFSEGELLQSWKQLQIEGIPEVRIKFMRFFVNYMKESVSRDRDTVFLLNRFHLSAYVSTVSRYPHLRGQYDEIIAILRTLPVHVFVLQLDEKEIDERSLHPERSIWWSKYQSEIINKEGFKTPWHRRAWQQKLIFETAKKQGLAYSIINVSCLTDDRKFVGSDSLSITSSSRVSMNKV
ncbi:MAG TPA: hypothetical protein VGH16_07805 [Candidatus Binatia bacterium]